MSRFKRSRKLWVILPTEEVIEPIAESLEDYNIRFVDIRQLVRIAMETWADVRGIGHQGQIYMPRGIVDQDPIPLLHDRLLDDVVLPMADTYTPDFLSRAHAAEVLADAANMAYLTVDSYLDHCGDLDTDAPMTMLRMRWLSSDLGVLFLR